MDIININKFIKILEGQKKENVTALTLEQINTLFEEYKDNAVYGDSKMGYITKPGKEYNEK